MRHIRQYWEDCTVWRRLRFGADIVALVFWRQAILAPTFWCRCFDAKTFWRWAEWGNACRHSSKWYWLREQVRTYIMIGKTGSENFYWVMKTFMVIWWYNIRKVCARFDKIGPQHLNIEIFYDREDRVSLFQRFSRIVAKSGPISLLSRKR